MPPILVLIGSPGAGKTSVGRRVAERKHLPFADSDHLVEAVAGASVSDIFVNQGEAAFRDLEADTIATALQERTGVLSLGGGAVLREETRRRLAGVPVGWLKVSLNEAVSRVGMNTARPLLLGNVRGTLSSLMAAREPIYAEVSDFVVDTSGRPLRDVVTEVCARLDEGAGR